ncbi:MAG: UDP-N-acetylmuramate dehydrogenase [Winogradskyella sp.]|uniref:UDP-N-acetylmuramate dehydrogenase n=1 Tax=Winogradskyella sp. TaxID=1883156 RepID=UPI0017EFDBC8|nr:UDP-N-acetylmuramate dehydrogenase [Winogradskyella sp.]MBT8244504.1 UDP-N-acetylmuramate dehydrogenase [Winogradskyella sp.]NNK23946.1 UDP-N-acetylmuramate dehydrogenase [Winogradskyella sp.]
MNVRENVSLKDFNTFGIDAKANRYTNITTLNDLKYILKTEAPKPIFILGGGSNMLLTNDIDALVFHINLKGTKILEETVNHAIVEAQAGENWHEFVLWCLENNLGGIENLSLIPGNIGTAPIQNIGAYGVELKDVFHSCNAINIKTQEIKTFSKLDCQFGYRESIFKRGLKSKYIITSVCLQLTKNNHKLQTDYGAITSELGRLKIENPSIKDVSKAVINIRQSKLPDPKQIGNSGSFFKNPIISKIQFEELKKDFPNAPHYIISETEIKIPAGWLIEIAGFKGKRFGNYGVHNKQALVLVNYGEALGEDIFKLAKLIQKTVLRLFDIKIETEVNII